jgi:hypothetical protein
VTFVFRPISESESPAGGTLYMCPAGAEHQERLDLAVLVLKHGVASLRQGEGPIRQIVVGADPTLDEMLAATIAEELLVGRQLPAGLEPFARYAALVREGLTPSQISLETSLEGIYLAIRSAAGENLADAANGERFAADWSRMAAAILQAASAGQDPFTSSLFAQGAEFARERAFLASDRAVYSHDLRRGEQWVVSIPGGPPHGRALVLRQPTSLLFKQWSRSEKDSGATQPFIFLAVNWGPRQWVFTTDPIQRLPIKSLADALQAAEATCDAAAAKRDPWFDGKPFGHTLVAAPRQGTKLSDRQVLGVVRRWGRARGARPSPHWALAAAALVLICSLPLYWLVHQTPPDPKPRGLEFVKVSADTAGDPIDVKGGKNYALIFAGDEYKHWPKLCNAESDARKIADILRDEYGFIVDPCIGADYTNNRFFDKVREYRNKDFQPNDQLLIYIAGHGAKIEQKGYLVATDSLSSTESINDQIKSYYSLAELHDDMEKTALRCRHVFLVLDTCFGGMFDFDTATNQASRGRDDELTPMPKAALVARKMQHRCCAYLASVGRHTASDGQCGEHSPFAKPLIAMLDAAKPGDVLTIPHWFVAVDSDETDPRNGLLRGSESGGDFVFIRK